MTDYQKFIYNNNYSTEAENLERIQEKKLLDARDMLSNEVETAKNEAFEKGFEEGQKMALEKLKSEMDLHVNTIIESITKINNFKPELQSIYEQHSTACVRHIAKNMFFKSEEMFAERLLEQSLDNALNNLPMVSKIIVKIPTNCKVYLEDTQVEDKIRQRGITDFLFVEDATLHSGECRIEWDKSGLLSSKAESFEKVNATFAAFLSPEELELSDNTRALAASESLKSEDEPAEQIEAAPETEEAALEAEETIAITDEPAEVEQIVAPAEQPIVTN